MASGVCYHHQSRPAVARCTLCGKGICRDCYDSYGSGVGGGKALCFDCAEELVKDDAAEIAMFRKRVKRERVLMIIGMVVGAGVGAAGGPLGMLLGAAIGGSLWTIVKLGDEYGAIVAVPALIVSPIITIVRFVKRAKQIRQCNEIIADEMRTIQEMRDYFEYTQAMEQSASIDLAKLAKQGGKLFDNSYASAVLSKGEQAAQAQLRQSVVQIAANGEIIRGFAPVKKKGNAAA